MGSVVADLVWLNVPTAWMNEEWFRMSGYINLCMALQPVSYTHLDVYKRQPRRRIASGKMPFAKKKKCAPAC